MSTTLQFIQNNLDSILAIVGMILAWIISRPWAQAQKEKANAMIESMNMVAVADLAASVAQRVYQDTVRTLKNTTAWNDDMKRKVLNDAVEILKTEAKEHGLEIATAALPGIMQKAVNLLKTDGAAAKGQALGNS